MKLLITLYLALIVVVGAGSIYHAQSKPDASHVFLKAQIAQLSAQLEDTRASLAVCGANLAISQQPQSVQARERARAAIEQEAGCAIDWNVTPPVCRPEAVTSSQKESKP